MRASFVVAGLMLAMGVAYVVHGVAFRTAGGPVVPGRPVEPPVGIPVVRTWGQLLEQPAVDLPSGLRVHVGIETDSVPGRSGVLLYVLAEAGSSARAPADDALRLMAAPTTVDAGPTSFRVMEAALFLRPDDELDPNPDRHRLFVWSVAGTEGAEALRLTLWYTDAIATPDTLPPRGPLVVAETTVRVGAPVDAPWLTLRQTQEIGRRFASYGPAGPGPWAAPAFDRMRPFETARPDEALRRRALPTLIPNEPTTGFRLTPSDGGFVITSEREIQLTWPDEFLLVRYTVNGRLPAVTVPQLEEEARRGSTSLGHTLDIELDVPAFGAGPGDVLTIEALWCLGGHTFGDGRARLVFETGPGPRGPMRSNRITLRVP